MDFFCSSSFFSSIFEQDLKVRVDVTMNGHVGLCGQFTDHLGLFRGTILLAVPHGNDPCVDDSLEAGQAGEGGGVDGSTLGSGIPRIRNSILLCMQTQAL